MHDARRATEIPDQVPSNRGDKTCAHIAHPCHVANRTSAMYAWHRHVLPKFFARLTYTVALLSLCAPTWVAAQVLAGGGFHNCTTTPAGGVVCWGANSSGQLGDNSTTARPQPVNVIGLPFGATALAGGHGTVGHTCAVVSGAVKCWGGNDKGQLGDNSTTQRLTPVEVTGLGSGMTKVSAGDGFSCALSNTGGVSCWGRNNNGQLGGGDNTENSLR